MTSQIHLRIKFIWQITTLKKQRNKQVQRSIAKISLQASEATRASLTGRNTSLKIIVKNCWTQNELNQRVKNSWVPTLGVSTPSQGLNQGAPSDSYGENRRKLSQQERRKSNCIKICPECFSVIKACSVRETTSSEFYLTQERAMRQLQLLFSLPFSREKRKKKRHTYEVTTSTQTH